ncbi:Hypothetical predicted protein, partial [Marmota monax]
GNAPHACDVRETRWMRLALTVQVLRACGPLAPSRFEDIEISRCRGRRQQRAHLALGLTLRAKETEKAPFS